jgi:hypothetical protein
MIKPINRCKVCRKGFEFVNRRVGYLCPQHLTGPSRFRLYVWIEQDRSKRRLRSNRDRHGSLLQSYQQALKLLDELRNNGSML